MSDDLRRAADPLTYPSPDDFAAMSDAEFETYLERTGLAERIRKAMAESDRRHRLRRLLRRLHIQRIGESK